MAQPTVAELRRMLAEEKARNEASVEVQRDYLAQIEDLRQQLKAVTFTAKKVAADEWKRERELLEDELDMYRALIKGWPKGRRLVKRLTRDPYDY